MRTTIEDVYSAPKRLDPSGDKKTSDQEENTPTPMSPANRKYATTILELANAIRAANDKCLKSEDADKEWERVVTLAKGAEEGE